MAKFTVQAGSLILECEVVPSGWQLQYTVRGPYVSAGVRLEHPQTWAADYSITEVAVEARAIAQQIANQKAGVR